MAYKVIMWGTGQIGITVLEEVIDNPDLELVGLPVYSDWKVGKDAGEIVDFYKEMLSGILAAMNGGEPDEIVPREKTGVIATQSVEEILALDADVVLYLPLNPAGKLDEINETIQRMLRAGKNVITTVAHTYPQAHGEAYLKSFEEACIEGNATLFGTGINPGVITERIATTLTSMCTDVTRMHITEVYDCSAAPSPDFVFELMGAGRPAAYFEKEPDGAARTFELIFPEVIGFVGHAMNIKFDEIIPEHEFGVTEKDLQIAAGTVSAGGVANFRRRWHGLKGGEPFITIEMVWLTDPEMEGWGAPDGYTIKIEGKPGVHATVELSDPDRGRHPGAWFAIQYATAGPVIRAIPDVVKAPAGILLPTVFAPYTPNM